MGAIIYVVMAAAVLPARDDSDPSRFDGTFTEGYGVSLYLTPEGKMMTIDNDWDLNDDGWLDMLVVNEFEWRDGKQEQNTYSYVFWGSENGFSRTRCDSFFTHGAECAALADFDRDGWTDIVIANSTCDYSYVIYGSSTGYTSSRRDSFKTRPNHGSISVAELNGDGWLDLVWSNWFGWGAGYSRIYWGSKDGFDVARTDSLPTGPAHGNVVADFNADGYADILWAAYYAKDDRTRRPSLIYWGAAEGFDPDRRTELATVGPGDDISVADLDKDGLMDIVIPNHSSEPPPVWTAYDYSYIYYGQGGRKFKLDSLYAYGPWASSVADVNQDGWLDIVFACSADDCSILYKGSRNGFKEAEMLPVRGASCVMLADFNGDGRCDMALGSQATSQMNIFYLRNEGWEQESLSAKGIDAGITRDPGNPATHKDEAFYVSSVIPLTSSPDSIGFLEDFEIRFSSDWKGFPLLDRSDVELWVSGGTHPYDGIWGDWVKVEQKGPYPVTGRAFRYGLCFKTGMCASLSVDKVELRFKVDKVPESAKIDQKAGRMFDIWIGNSSLLSATIQSTIYDLSGRRVRILHPDPSGHVYWLGEDDSGQKLPAGIYFLVIQRAEQTSSHKLVLLEY